MTEIQAIIKGKIEAAVKSAGCDEVVYQSEWLGYLPYGAYQWIECEGYDFTKDFPSGWSRDDISALEHYGFLIKINEHRNPKDEHDVRTLYRVQLEA